MFGRLGAQELIIVLAIVLLIFGPRKLPEIGSALGKSIKGFKQASREMQGDSEKDEKDENDADKETDENSKQDSSS